MCSDVDAVQKGQCSFVFVRSHVVSEKSEHPLSTWITSLICGLYDRFMTNANVSALNWVKFLKL